MRGSAWTLALALGASSPSWALKMPNAIDSNMVLQREPLASRLWGWSNASSTVTISLDGADVATATAAADGSWVAELPVQKASTGRTVGVRDGSASVVLANVAFGDVYLCSGQSNMEFSTNDAFQGADEIADSGSYADLRLYTIKDTASDTPCTDGVSKAPGYRWSPSQPEAFVAPGAGSFSYFSATCYFFGRDLYKALAKANGGTAVPVGLVASDWGGQTVEAFSSPDALADATCGGTAAPTAAEAAAHAARAALPLRRRTALERVAVDAVADATGGAGPVPNPSASQLWFGQIYPFLHMRFTGAAWYQGESNSGDPPSYACRFPAMIADWRTKFGLPDLSFFFVQLAAFSSDYSLIREAQMAALALPKVGYATAIDLGDPTSPNGNIHPRRKQEVGRRLALATQQIQYGMDVVGVGPTLKTDSAASVKYGDDGSVTLAFDPSTAQGLHFEGTAACGECCNVAPIELTLDGATWQRADAATLAVDSAASTITARLPGAAAANATVVGVRFDWEGYPQCALYNGAGGPDDHAGIAAKPFKYTQPLPPPSSWAPLFRQTAPFLWPAGVLSLNASSPDADNFATLDTLEEHRDAATGGFDLKMVWPQDPAATEVVEWKQITNPATDRTKSVAGFELISAAAPSKGFEGLAYNGLASECLFDGQPSQSTWFWCIGYFGVDWGKGISIPGSINTGRAAEVVELYALVPSTGRYSLVFRQTLPYLWPAGDTMTLSPADAGNETFAVLDTLESFRLPDGKIQFKMLWPDRANTWRQTSNPMTRATAGVDGFLPLKMAYTGNSFGGLEKCFSNPANTMLDADVSPDTWFYPIGYLGGWAAGFMPDYGSNTGSKQVELYVRKPAVKQA